MISISAESLASRWGRVEPRLGATGKAMLVTLAIWLAFCLAFSLLLANSSQTVQAPKSLPINLQIVFFSYLPLILASLALVLAYAHKSDWMLSPIGLLLTAAAMLLLLLPVMEVCSVLAMLWAKNKPYSEFLTVLKNRGVFIWWIHGCFVVLSFVGQAAYASLRRSQAQEQLWQQQQTEKLALRLRLLQGQLKPHFLFNALNSISALARAADRSLASKALAKLRQLLSYAVHASNQDWLTVADEMGFIRDYLDLQMLRYGERLSLEWDCADLAWERLACPPLLLQPLIENAIHHGVENHHARCTIRIALALQQDSVRFTVENPLIETKNRKKSHQGHGIGSSTTIERLRLLYQDEAQLLTQIDQARQVVVTVLQFPARSSYVR